MIKLYLASAIFIQAMIFGTPSQAIELDNINNQNLKDRTSIVLPYDIDTVHERLLVQFDSDARSFFEDYNSAIYILPNKSRDIKELSKDEREKFIKDPLIYSNKFYVFYGAYNNQQQRLLDITPLSVVSFDNVALANYAKLPVKERTYDIYLWSPDAPYWLSEYALNGVSVPFKSYFILHLTPQDENHTIVEAIEDYPAVKAGKKLSVDSHGVVHRDHVIPVSPTTRDREFLLSCIRQFNERGLPSRKIFNCKAE